MNLQYDCIKWSTDKGRTSLYEWFPESPSISRLPEIYAIGPDGAALYHKPTNTPVITYSNNEFKILTSITDWEMYIFLFQKEGFVTFSDDITVKIGAIVSKCPEKQLTTIRGNATLVYHDSIWSQSSIVADGITIRGHEDGAHQDRSFIYCDNFGGLNLDISGINRIYGKGNVVLKNCMIRDEENEEEYISQETSMDKLSGMYLYAGLDMKMSNCDIHIHNFIRGRCVQITDSKIEVNNLVSDHPCIQALNRLCMEHVSARMRRKYCSPDPLTSSLIALEDGEMILDHSEIDLVSKVVIRAYPCIRVGLGTVFMDSSSVTATRYPKAIIVKSYGSPFVNRAGKTIDMDFEMDSDIMNAEYRFMAAVGGYTVWVYVENGIVTDVECIEGDFKNFHSESESIMKYIQDNFGYIRNGASRTELKAEYVSACAHGGNPLHIRVN